MAGFTIGDQRYMAINAGPLDPFNHSFSIMVECDSQGPTSSDHSLFPYQNLRRPVYPLDAL